jgi:hypothetical protein
LLELLNITSRDFTPGLLKELLQEMLATQEWISKSIYEARAKDYSNPYRRMVYENEKEMQQVIGRIENNGFIQSQMEALDKLKTKVNGLVKKWKLR